MMKIKISLSFIILSLTPLLLIGGETVYVANKFSNNLTAISISDDSTSTQAAGIGPTGGVSLSTGDNYTINQFSNSITSSATSHTVSSTISVGNNAVQSVIHPNGLTLYALNFSDDSISVIDTTTNTVTTTVTKGPDTAQYNDMTITQDGSRLYLVGQTASGSNGLIHYIDTSDNSMNTLVSSAGGNIFYTVKVTPNGSKIFCMSDNQGIIGYNSSGSLLFFTNYTSNGLDISPDGNTIYSTNLFNSLIKVYNNSGSEINEINTGSLFPSTIKISPDGLNAILKGLSNGFDYGYFSIINLSTETIYADRIFLGSGSHISDFAFSSDGSKVYICNENNDEVTVVDVYTGSTDATISSITSPFSIITSKATNKAYAGGSGGVHVIDMSTNSVIESDIGSTSKHLTLDPTLHAIYSANGYSDTVTKIKTNHFGSESGPLSIIKSSDDSKIYTANLLAGTVSIHDRSNNTITNVAVGSGPIALAIKSDDSKVYVANYYAGTVSEITTATNTVTDTITVGNGPNKLVLLSDDSKLLVTNSLEDTVTVVTTSDNSTTTVNL